jgi:hypothetical protein
MAKRDINNLGDIYGGMLNTLKYNLVKEGKIKKGGNDFNDGMPLDGKGPHVDGFHVALDDCGCSNHNEEDEEHEDENLEDDQLEDDDVEKEDNDEEEIKEETRKIGKQILNSVMTKKTLSFDKLYARVIKENWGMEDAEDESIDALGLEDKPMDDEFGGEEGGDDEEVTITLPKSLAQQFHNIFAGVLDDNLEGDFGGEDDDYEGDDDLDFGGGDDGEYGKDGEDEEDEEGEASELPSTAGHSLTGKNNKVGGTLGKAKKSSASAKVTDEVGTKENFGTNVNMGTGSGNKVGKAYKPGSGYFQ